MINSLCNTLKKQTLSLLNQCIIAAFLGAIQVFAFAPFNQFWILYVSFIGFFFLLKQVQKTNQRNFLVAYLFSISMFISTIHWIYVSMDQFGGIPIIFSILLIILFAGYLALYPALALWASTRFPKLSDSIRYLLLIPVFWLISDWLRGYILTGFPWGYLGYSHIDTPLIGFAPILGGEGVTLAIMIICGALMLIATKQKVILNLMIIFGLLIAGTGLQKINYTTLQPAVKVTLVQGNIAQSQKWLPAELAPSLIKYFNLSKITNDDQQELIIWPESAIAALELNMQKFLHSLSDQLTTNNKTLISGIISYQPEGNKYYNSVITLGKQPNGQKYSLESKNRYQKHHLLPIGEFVPFEDLLRPLAPLFNLPMSSFQRGDEVQPNLQTRGMTLATALCYEIAYPEQLRKNVHRDTGMILTLSNDGWFGRSIGPAQHLQIARMRAIEFARPLLRSTNNGITAIFGRNGQTLGELPSNQAAVLTKAVQPAYGTTPYQSYGSIPLYLYCLLIICLCVYQQKRIAKK